MPYMVDRRGSATRPPDTRDEVLRRRAKGHTYREIADELGISTQRVWQILDAAGATNSKRATA